MCVLTSGVTVSEYFEMMLASIEKYLLSGIARQRDMSKIATQSANDTDCNAQILKFLESVGQVVEKVRSGIGR